MTRGVQPRRVKRQVDGVVLLDKPLGMTSNAALLKLRWLFSATKAGHTGTLDPMATGLLPICLGEATKFAGFMLDADKTYETVVRLGVVTRTADAEGEILLTRPVHVTADQIEPVLARFRGRIEQVPPMYSALKHHGKALYEYARAGIEIEREARPVDIHELTCLGFDGLDLYLRVSCSKGTYIRTLGADIGEALGCGGHLIALRRTRIGRFGLDQALMLDSLEQMDMAARDTVLQPVDGLIMDLPVVTLSADEAHRITHGQAISRSVLAGEVGGGASLRAYHDGRFLGVLSADGDGGLKPQRLLATGEAR